VKRFANLPVAPIWLDLFVQRYNHPHHHSATHFVTPEDRHTDRELAILAARQRVHERARDKRPERWRAATLVWTRVTTVRLKPTECDLMDQRMTQSIRSCDNYLVSSIRVSESSC
jgi:putative transposase